jgi:hypothetical protein
MKEKTNTVHTTKAESEAQLGPISHMSQDLKNSILIVSLVANLFMFTAWIAIQITSRFDTQLASFLFS